MKGNQHTYWEGVKEQKHSSLFFFFFVYFVNLDTLLDSELSTRLSTPLKLRRIFNDAHL